MIEYVIKNLDKNKTLSWDYLPIRIFLELIDDNNNGNYDIIIEKLKNLFNNMIEPESPLP